jgi:flagellar basal-body rod protein FlgF
MLTGLYQGAAAMSGLEKWQDAISQNLANTSTSGYKGMSVAMHSRSTNDGSDFSSALGSEMVKPQASVNYAKGSFMHTDEPLSCAIEGDGFFKVQTADGQTKYTRNGQFHMDSANKLVSSDGETVLGQSGPITANPGAGEVSIRASGSVYQGEALIGTLAISKVAKEEALVPAGGGYSVADPNAAGVTDVTSPKILQGVYENSNVSAMREMVSMIEVSRAYEANAKVITSADTTLGKAIQAFSA